VRKKEGGGFAGGRGRNTPTGPAKGGFLRPQAVDACFAPPAARVQPAVFPRKATTLSAGFRMRSICAASALSLLST
jgi:hypothetical protein